MNRTYLIDKNPVLFVCLLFCFVSYTGYSGSMGNTRGRDNGPSPAEQRRELMQQQAQSTAMEIDRTLRDFLELTNKNQRPQDAQIQQAAALLEDSKQYAAAFDDKQKAQFMLLQSWTYFYQKNTLQAFNWSSRSSKANEASKDAWNSQALFSMLMSRSPRVPRVDQPDTTSQTRRTSSRRRRNVEPTSSTVTVQPYSQQGVLDCDLFGLNTRIVKEELGRVELYTASGEKFEYKPGTDTLCALFWQDVPISPGDADDMQQQLQSASQGLVNQAIRGIDPRMQRGAREMVNGMTPGMAGDMLSAATVDIETQRSYVESLREACADRPNVKFVQINVFDPPQPEALNALSDFSQEAIPVVIAAAPDSNGRQFLDWDWEQPYMVIVDVEGKVKYAGTADGFMPAFILTEVTGIPIDLDKQQQAGQDRMQTPDMRMQMLRNTGRDPNQPADPNQPIVYNELTSGRVVPGRPPDVTPLSLEDEVQAEKLLQSAQMHIEESRKLRAKNPRQGIEDARKVLQQYPNTTYADQARELLRRVPDRWRRPYNITDEELGY